MGLLSGLVQGAAKARIGYNEGEAEKRQADAQQQVLAMKIALEEQNKKRSQGNLDRVFGETKRHNEAMELKSGAPKRDIVADHQAMRDYDVSHPLPSRRTQGVSSGVSGGSSPAQAKAAKPPTEAQAKANSFYKIAAAEEPTLEDMENNLGQKYLNKIPVIGNTITGHNDSKYQAQVAAGERWINQYLRFQSGAAISEGEFENARKQFIPQPGDKPETIAAKKAARQRALQGLQEATGQSAPAPNVNNDAAQSDFVAQSKALQNAYEAYIGRGGDPKIGQIKLDSEMNKLRKRFDSANRR